MTHFQVQRMTDTKMVLLGAITLMAVTTSLADKQNVSSSLSLCSIPWIKLSNRVLMQCSEH